MLRYHGASLSGEVPPGDRCVTFSRDHLLHAAEEAGLERPKNIGDLVYSFRYRYELPKAIQARAPHGLHWVIRPAGKSLYRFVAVAQPLIVPNPALLTTKVPDGTPGVIGLYSLSDEQALLAKLRYNRLVDVFTGVTCYSLQSHLRTFVEAVGQTETDEIYVGIDKRGAHYVLPVQAKGAKDRISIVQVEQDLAMCAAKFPALICRPIAAQFMEGGLLAMFELASDKTGMRIGHERHYLLVEPTDLTPAELEQYGRLPLE